MATRTGKIARLPEKIRDEINRRLLDGLTAARFCHGFNALPEVKRYWVKILKGYPSMIKI